jgi:hypothetical protein
MQAELKSLLIGVLLGAVCVLALGANSGSREIGFGVPSGGKAVIRAHNGETFVIDMEEAMGKRILFKKPEPADPRYPTTKNGFPIKVGF